MLKNPSGMNYNYIVALYQKYRNGDDSLSNEWKQYFQGLDPEALPNENDLLLCKDNEDRESTITDRDTEKIKNSEINSDTLQTKILELIESFRRYGHLYTNLDPLKLQQQKYIAALDYTSYNINEQEVEKGVYHKKIFNSINLPIKKLFKYLSATYTNRLGLEFYHLDNIIEREWIREEIEKDIGVIKTQQQEQIQIYNSIIQTEMFEKYLHTKFPGAKRFSIEGGEATVIALKQTIKTYMENDIQESVLGMSHRGRLNILATIIRKPYHAIFSEFRGGTFIPNHINLPGDVKYHLGASSDIKVLDKTMHLTLTYNPSHLEAVNSVVLGRVRAKQDHIKDKLQKKVTAILIHGDASFAGQGSVMESLALSGVNAYKTGGTLHIISNNQIGFTTDTIHARSSRYCTDVAKMINAPIFHVNGNDPEAVAYITDLASKYRIKFQKDVFIDIVCYRKFGHNEGDEPMFTQPTMYRAIHNMENLSKLYEKQLVNTHVLNQNDISNTKKKFQDLLNDEFLKSQEYTPLQENCLSSEWKQFNNSSDKTSHNVNTGIKSAILQDFTTKLTHLPQSMHVHPKIRKIYQQRNLMLTSGENLDWGMGETLTYATLLYNGYHVRITGQDVERGTFSHRHASIHDQQSNTKYTPLKCLGSLQNASFEIHNSILSEFAVLGFEYGYSLSSPRTLVIWEAQFGDFANGAQVIIDQFISSGQAKWMRMSGLVMLLPHGYEGQGPEHSSARLERFLQLCANNNMTIANCTTPSSFFHLLRRQMLWNIRIPLVVMTPKSLLRHKLAVSNLQEFTEHSKFNKIISENVTVSKIKKVIFCSGKVFYDLFEYRKKHHLDYISLIRLEQLYPFPEQEIQRELKKYIHIENITWCQEEHSNMGAWSYIKPRFEQVIKQLGLSKTIRYVGRKESASPAAGYVGLHQQEYKELIAAVFKI